MHDQNINEVTIENGISIVILSYERMDALEQLLKSVLGQDMGGMGLELIVCNNSDKFHLAQGDGTEVGEMLSQFDDVKIFNSSYNWKCKVRYALATLARYETILFIDDDIIIERADFVRYMYENFKTLRPMDILSCHCRLWVDWDEDSLTSTLLNFKTSGVDELIETDVCGCGISMFNKQLAMDPAILRMPPKYPESTDMGFSLVAWLACGSRNYYLPSYEMLSFHEEWRHGAICTTPSYNRSALALYKYLLDEGYQPVKNRMAEKMSGSSWTASDFPKERFQWTLNPKNKVEPFISIVVPTYNRGVYIEEAVNSALSQDYDKLEILVVDDGSDDNTAGIVSQIGSDKVRYIRKEHTCAPDTRNRGISEAKGEYILWLDSDDVLMPGVIEQYIEALSYYPDADVIYGDLDITDEQLNIKDHQYFSDYYYIDSLPRKMVVSNCLPQPGSMVRSSVYDRFGGYDVEFRRAHDYEFWARVSGDIKAKHCGQTVLKWRWHDDNMSSGTVEKDMSYEARITHRLIERHKLLELFPQFDWDDKERAEAKAFVDIGNIFTKWNAYDDAYIYFKKCIDLSGMAVDGATIANACNGVGNIAMINGDLGLAVEYFERGLGV